MKALVLKTVNEKMKAYGGFKWPSSGKVKCKDWDPKPECGNGFHGLLWGEGDYGHLQQEDETRKWLVLEVDKDKLVDLDGKVKFEECEVIYCGDRAGSCEVILERNPKAACPGSGKEYFFKDICGNKFWYKNGKYHREGGPAIEFVNGNKFWYKEGEYHRLDGPAVEYINGDKFWYKEGKYHREDGPAIEYTDGVKFWYKEGKPHRLDGPACEYASGTKEYYIEGRLLTKEVFEESFKND